MNSNCNQRLGFAKPNCELFLGTQIRCDGPSIIDLRGRAAFNKRQSSMIWIAGVASISQIPFFLLFLN